MIIAISHLLWPVAFIVCVFIFKNEISEILKRIKKGKILGQELELEREISEFKSATEIASQSIPVFKKIINKQMTKNYEKT